MTSELNAEMEGFVGSRTRLLTLAALANSPVPLTGYRIAKTTGLPRVKVYSELHRAQTFGLVKKEEKFYSILDRDIQALLQRRVRIMSLDAWADEKQRLKSDTLAAVRRLRELPPPHSAPLRTSNPGAGPRGRDRQRKDSVLRRVGLKASSHG